MLFDPNQKATLMEIHSWPQFKTLRMHFDVYAKGLAEIEKAVLELDKKGKEIKAKLGKGLSFGFDSK